MFAALVDSELEDHFDDPEVAESWARVTVDTDREVVSHAEFRINLTDSGTDRVYDAHSEYEYVVDTDVDRPAELGTPRASEWLWKLFAY